MTICSTRSVRRLQPGVRKTGATSQARANSHGGLCVRHRKLNKQWQADLGVRWDHVKVDYTTVSATTRRGAHVFGRVDTAVTGRSRPRLQAGRERQHLRRVQHVVHAVLRRHARPDAGGDRRNSQALPPEKTHNIEVGTKWDLAPGARSSPRRCSTCEKTNAKTTDVTGATVLAGDQHVTGVEFGLSGNITPRWSVFGGLSLMNGEVKDSGIASEVGAQLPYVPKATFNLWSTYRLPMGLTLGGGANYNGGNYFNQTGTFNFVAGGTVPQPKYAPNAAAIQALTKYWCSTRWRAIR